MYASIPKGKHLIGQTVANPWVVGFNRFSIKILSLRSPFGFDTETKSHTCEESGAHLKISFWHLLINLKNK